MKHYNGANNTPAISEAFSTSAKRTLTVDVEKYQKFLDGADLTLACPLKSGPP